MLGIAECLTCTTTLPSLIEQFALPVGIFLDGLVVCVLPLDEREVELLHFGKELVDVLLPLVELREPFQPILSVRRKNHAVLLIVLVVGHQIA